MKEFIKYVKDASIYNIGYIGYGDIYDILNSGNIDYTACIIEKEETIHNQGVSVYNYRFTIVDRLTEDESNLLDIYDTSEKQLNDLIIYIKEKYDIEENYNIQYIKQDFSDKLAGIYITLSIYEDAYNCQYQ